MANQFGMDIIRTDVGKYKISIQLTNGWNLTHFVDDDGLQTMINTINKVRGVSSVMELFSCTEEQALELLAVWGEGSPYNRPGTRGYLIAQDKCKDCQFKRKECFKCQFICQSPLERSMLLEFKRRGVDPILQRRISKDGTMYDYPNEVEKETILTIPDFYLEGEREKVCIYADGGTYHYNNEQQGIRDRSIDIALQNLGFKVLRYTGSQIREDVAAVVDGILKSVN